MALRTRSSSRGWLGGAGSGISTQPVIARSRNPGQLRETRRDEKRRARLPGRAEAAKSGLAAAVPLPQLEPETPKNIARGNRIDPSLGHLAFAPLGLVVPGLLVGRLVVRFDGRLQASQELAGESGPGLCVELEC